MSASQDLIKIAKTTLSSKILTGDKEHFSNLAVDAILRLKGGYIQIIVWTSPASGLVLNGRDWDMKENLEPV